MTTLILTYGFSLLSSKSKIKIASLKTKLTRIILSLIAIINITKILQKEGFKYPTEKTKVRGTKRLEKSTTV